MLFLRVLGAMLLAAIICAVCGIMKDYFHLWPDANYQYVWPAAMGASGALGALIMAIAKPSRLVQGAPALKPRPQHKVSPASTAQAPKTAHATASPAAAPPHATSAEVPGMPTFDFDKARAAGSAMDSAAGAGSRPAGQEDGQ